MKHKDSQLLDRIGGKYGDGSDYEDIGNDADEDALLEDNIFDDVESSNIKHDYAGNPNEFYNELDETDTDVLDLEAQDVELDDDLEDKNNVSTNNLLMVSSTTQSDHNLDITTSNSAEEHARGTDKFKNERQTTSKFISIPNSLDEVSVVQTNKQGFSRRRTGQRNRNRGMLSGNQRNFSQKNQRTDNKTVLINPHFKGQVKINNETRLAWDARQKLNQRHQNQINKVQPLLPLDKPVDSTIQPWAAPQNNVPPYQPAQQHMYPPLFQQQQHQHQQLPPQHPPQAWNPYPNNNYNQIPQQQIPVTHQNVFMQPLPPPPPTPYSNQPFPPHQPQYNPPMQQYHQSPMYSNQNMNPPYNNNTQYMQPPPPLNNYNQHLESYVPNFTPNQPPPPSFNSSNIQYNRPPPNLFNQPSGNQFNITPQPNHIVTSQPNHPISQTNDYTQRFARPKTNNFKSPVKFNKQTPIKRRLEANVDLRKKKRVIQSNLHEVQTVETPDTTVKEEKPIPDDEDEETKLYRRKIEEQKRIREKVFAEKEKRRQEAILKSAGNSSSNPPIVTAVLGNKTQQQSPQHAKNIGSLQVSQNNSNLTGCTKGILNSELRKRVYNSNHNIKVINTDSDESHFDKQHIASFLSNRKIIAKDQSLVDTSIVVVSNLAAGTTDVKLRKMCQGIGDIKKLQMSPKERQATIEFNSVASAHEFFKKFQRSMLDLSMIQVTLKSVS